MRRISLAAAAAAATASSRQVTILDFRAGSGTLALYAIEEVNGDSFDAHVLYAPQMYSEMLLNVFQRGRFPRLKATVAGRRVTVIASVHGVGPEEVIRFLESAEQRGGSYAIVEVDSVSVIVQDGSYIFATGSGPATTLLGVAYDNSIGVITKGIIESDGGAAVSLGTALLGVSINLQLALSANPDILGEPVDKVVSEYMGSGVIPYRAFRVHFAIPVELTGDAGEQVGSDGGAGRGGAAAGEQSVSRGAGEAGSAAALLEELRRRAMEVVREALDEGE